MNLASLRSRQYGVSLIELMVAMVIGLFLILGVTQIFISNQRGYIFQQGQMGNQENGRFTLALLSQELLKAGYRSNLGTVLPADSTTLGGCSFGQGVGVTALSSSSLCIQYQTDNKADTSCLGTALVAADISAIQKPYSAAPFEVGTRPKIVERIALDAGTNSITCTTTSTTQPMVTGVRDLRFEYGVPSGNTITFTSVPAAITGIVSVVRYSALMQSPGTAAMRDNTAQISPALSDWNSRYGTTYNDTASIYQIVQGTIMIRNQMQ